MNPATQTLAVRHSGWVARLADLSALRIGVPGCCRNWLVLVFICGTVAGSRAAEARQYAPTNLWSVELNGRTLSSPALDTTGVIYIATMAGDLVALNPDGSTRWTYRFGFETASTPAIDDSGTIYFGCRDRRVYAVDGRGHLKWSFKTGGWVDASPAIAADGTVCIGSWDRNFYALDRDGNPRWQFQTAAPITASAAIDSAGVIYFGSHDQTFYALLPDGTKKWGYATRGAILSSPAIGGNGVLYFTSTDGFLYALNSDGTERWKLRTGGINSSSPVLGADGTIYLGINSNHCVISAEGKLLGSMHLGQNGYAPFDWIVATGIALTDGSAITAGTDMLLSIQDQAGRCWYTSLGSGIRSSPVLTSDGRVYCAGFHTALHAFKDFPAPAPSSWPMFRGNSQRNGRANAP